jgi:ketosteroid isomerase-like protein
VTSHDPDADRLAADRLEATIRELFARLSARDFDGMGELLADDVEFDLAYAPDMLPMPTTGRAAVLDLVGNVIGGMFDPFVVEVSTVYPGAEPGLVIAEYASDGTVTHNGNRYLNRYVGIFRVDSDGHITFWREYHDPEQATKALTA